LVSGLLSSHVKNNNLTHYYIIIIIITAARRSVVVGGTMLQAGKLWVRAPMSSFNYLNLPNPFSGTMTLGLTHPLIKLGIRKCFWEA
jgi:hypothetical protein